MYSVKLNVLQAGKKTEGVKQGKYSDLGMLSLLMLKEAAGFQRPHTQHIEVCLNLNK